MALSRGTSFQRCSQQEQWLGSTTFPLVSIHVHCVQMLFIYIFTMPVFGTKLRLYYVYFIVLNMLYLSMNS